MKYIASMQPRHEEQLPARGRALDDVDGVQIVELTGAEHAVVGSGSRRWIGVVIGIAVAITGFGFVGHGSDCGVHGRAVDEFAAATRSATPQAVDGANQSGDVALDVGGGPVVVIAPVSGATVTSGVTMTGGVVVVDAMARRPVGLVHASVSIGKLVLGSNDVEVRVSGPFTFRIPVFPPPFDAPVVLRIEATGSGDGGRFDVAREFDLNIPSAIGFWKASPTGVIDGRGRVQMAITGYGPLSARIVDIAIRDARGHQVAVQSTRVAVDLDLPGAAAGWVLGLGRFEAALWLPPNAERGLSLVATWRDAATGAELHIETALPATASTDGASPR